MLKITAIHGNGAFGPQLIPKHYQEWLNKLHIIAKEVGRDQNEIVPAHLPFTSISHDHDMALQWLEHHVKWFLVWASQPPSSLPQILGYKEKWEKEEDVPREAVEKCFIVGTPEECVENSDVLVVATTSKVPVLDGNWLTKGTHVNSIGVSGPEGRELDDTTVKKAKIVVDTKEGVLAETGDLIVPIKRGIISQENIYAELHEIVGGKKPGRTSDDEVTCWKAVGIAIEDAAVAKLVYDKAKKEGIGKEVEI